MAGATETRGHAGAGLYERLVGEAWGGLHTAVRGFHACGAAGAYNRTMKQNRGPWRAGAGDGKKN
jgi:hypothetical protein